MVKVLSKSQYPNFHKHLTKGIQDPPDDYPLDYHVSDDFLKFCDDIFANSDEDEVESIADKAEFANVGAGEGADGEASVEETAGAL